MLPPWDISRLEIPGNWFLATPDLALSFRRINYGISSFQSGASYYGVLSGKIIKWCYSNPYATARIKSHDSLRVALTLLRAARHFLGAHYSPLRLMLSGPPLGQQEVESLFACPVTWNAPRTEIWLETSALLHNQVEALCDHDGSSASISLFQLEKYLNMPQPHDLPKVLYEMVNYARYYGLPSVDTIATLFGISRQQLQRRLQQHGFNFTNLTGYILSNQAIKYMIEGRDIDEIAGLLGYANAQSFSKSFKRLRKYTPTQYIEKLQRKTFSDT